MPWLLLSSLARLLRRRLRCGLLVLTANLRHVGLASEFSSGILRVLRVLRVLCVLCVLRLVHSSLFVLFRHRSIHLLDVTEYNLYSTPSRYPSCFSQFTGLKNGLLRTSYVQSFLEVQNPEGITLKKAKEMFLNFCSLKGAPSHG